jgi:branched-chain amino acid transport system permease protein
VPAAGREEKRVDALANNLQVLFQGLALGSIYALVALGFVLIIRATNVVNFAQGDFAMLGGYAMVLFLVGMPGNPELGIPGFEVHFPYWLAIVLAVVVMAGIGLAFNYGVYYPLRNRSFLPVLISTLGASIFLQNTVLALFNPQPRPLDKLIPVEGVTIGGVFLDSQYLVILAFTVLAVVFQYFFFEHTLVGKKLQATSQDKDMARLLGIPVTLMIIITFIYSAILGGLAGILVAPILFVSIGMGSTIALKAFAATIIGGFGDVAGAIVGGIIIGLIESFAAYYISVPYKDAYAFLALFLVLLFRPQGIFGEKVSEKA